MPKHSYRTILKSSLRALLDFSKRERRRILLLLPLLVAITLLFMWGGKPRFERSFTMYSNGRITERDAAGNTAGHRPDAGNDNSAGTAGSVDLPAAGSNRKDSLFRFDPNTIDLDGLVALGFSARQAQGIVNYRNAGAVFRRPEDFSKCYTVSEEKFKELLPYIFITPTVSASRNSGDAGGESEAGRREDAAPTDAALYAPTRPLPPARPALVDLNGADSADLVKIRGIGALTAGRIIDYRRRLGGYASVEQLREVRGMYEENYQMIIQQIFADGSGIKKIDINFAHPESMKGHPYMPPEMFDKILKYRQLKGGWSNIGELVEENILSPAEAHKLAPYLYFKSE